MRVKKKSFTAEELFRLPTLDRRLELVKGELYEMPFEGARHGVVTSNIGFLVGLHAKNCNIGHVFAPGTGFILSRNPDTVLAPDVSFVSYDTLPTGDVPASFLELAPDLAVEVKSPGDSKREVREKAEQWLTAGTSVVWVLDPDDRTATVYALGRAPQVLTESESLTGRDLVPGFQVAVRELFE